MSLLGKILRPIMEWALERNGSAEYDGEGSRRWAYTIRDESTGDPYLSRILFPRIRLPLVGSFRVMVHRFHRGDVDRELHNHPWSRMLSIVLSGGYDEERLVGWVDGRPVTQTRRIRTLNWLTNRDYHRVEALHGDVFTVFVAGEECQDWEFLGRDGERTPWKEFIARRRTSGPSARTTATGADLERAPNDDDTPPEWRRRDDR